MAVAAKFTCPDDGTEFGLLWSFPPPKPVTCPKCGKLWQTELIMEGEAVKGARISGPAAE